MRCASRWMRKFFGAGESGQRSWHGVAVEDEGPGRVGVLRR